MKQIIELVFTEDENFFLIGKGDRGYYLKNRFTEIPNEFSGEKELQDVQKKFEMLCRDVAVEEVVPDTARLQMGQDGCSYVKAIFADRTAQWYRIEKYSFLFLETAVYTDFLEKPYYWRREWAEFTSLEGVRRICRQKVLDYVFLCKAVRNGWEDDYCWVDEVVEEDGRITFAYYCYTVCHWRIVIGRDGTIADTGGLRVMQVLKEQGVRVRKLNLAATFRSAYYE